MAGYDDRDGKIWMDGNMVDWRDANVHILTHAMHYASSVFEGERAYNGKIFKRLRAPAFFCRRAGFRSAIHGRSDRGGQDASAG